MHSFPTFLVLAPFFLLTGAACQQATSQEPDPGKHKPKEPEQLAKEKNEPHPGKEGAPNKDGPGQNGGGRAIPLSTVAFTPDGANGFFAWPREPGALWNLTKGRLIRTFPDEYRYGGALSPDGKRAVFANWEGDLALCEVATGAVLRVLRGHGKGLQEGDIFWPPLAALRFSPDGERVLSAGIDATLREWEVATGKELRRVRLPVKWLWRASFSPDGTRVAVLFGKDLDLQVWDLPTGKRVGFIPRRNLPQWRAAGLWATVALSSTGRYLLAGYADGQVWLWEVASGRPALKCHTDPDAHVHAVAISPNGKRFLSAHEGGVVRLWDLCSGERLQIMMGGGVGALAFSPDGKRALAGQVLFDLVRGEEIRTLGGGMSEEPPVTRVRFVPGGRFVASLCDDEITVHAVAEGREIIRLPTRRGLYPISSFAVFSDGKQILWAGQGTVGLWQWQTGKEPWKAKSEQSWPLDVAVSEDRHWALIGGNATEDDAIWLWDLSARKPLRKLPVHAGFAGSVAFSPDSKLALARGLDQIKRQSLIHLWEVPTGKLLRSFPDPQAGPVAFSSDGKLVLSCGMKIRGCDRVTGKLVSSSNRPEKEEVAFALSADGTLGLTGPTVGTLVVWDLKTGSAIRQLHPPKGTPHDVRTLAFSPDSRLAVAGAWGRRVVLWDVATGKLI
jgi:WD40 repeat protein